MHHCAATCTTLHCILSFNSTNRVSRSTLLPDEFAVRTRPPAQPLYRTVPTGTRVWTSSMSNRALVQSASSNMSSGVGYLVQRDGTSAGFKSPFTRSTTPWTSAVYVATVGAACFGLHMQWPRKVMTSARAAVFLVSAHVCTHWHVSNPSLPNQ